MSKRKVYRLEVLIVDHDNLGSEGVIAELENARYPNRCLMPTVINLNEREVEWSDEHPLNQHATRDAAFDALFEINRHDCP